MSSHGHAGTVVGGMPRACTLGTRSVWDALHDERPRCAVLHEGDPVELDVGGVAHDLLAHVSHLGPKAARDERGERIGHALLGPISHVAPHRSRGSRARRRAC